MINTTISIHTIMLGLAYLSNIIIVLSIYKKYNLTIDEIIGALIYESIGMIYGSKILYYLQNANSFKSFDLLNLGQTSYGALIGGIICLIIFKIQFKKDTKSIINTFIPAVPLMYSIGKIGCFISGCCYGIKYNGIGSIIYKYSTSAPNNTPLFPIQLIESIVFFIIFIYAIKKVKTDKFNSKELGKFLLICSISKFILDFFRANHTNTIISLNQVISIIFIITGLIIYKTQKNY